MGKVIATVGVIVGAVALAATGIGAIAAPALAGAVSIGGVSASTLLLAGTALQAVGSALTKRPKLSSSSTERLNASLVTDTPRKIAFGRTALNTDLRYQEWWGKDQEYCSQVFALASHHCEAVEEIWLDDKLAWTAASGVTPAFTGYFVVMTQPKAGPASLYRAGWSNRWGANATFNGCATLYLQFKVTGNGKKGQSPFSSSITSRVTVVGKGALLPDPRFDSTAGGSGAVRMADQTTWGWSTAGYESGRNPALALLFYLLGWRIQDPVTGTWKLAVGRGVPVDRIDLGSFITAANMCDETVQRASGGSEPRYRCDGTFSEGDDPSQVIASLETCMNAKLRDSAGRFALQVLHNDLATPVVDFTDDDVLGDFTWTAGNDLNDRRNVVRGRYTNPGALYQLVDFPQVRLAPVDGIERIDSIDLALVQSPSQAQRLAKQRLQRQQYEGTFAAEFNARAWAVKDGDVVRLTFAALGFNRKLFRVAEGLIDTTGVVPLALVEEHVDIYAWDRSESPAVEAAEPNQFNPLLAPIIVAIDEAGKTAEWPAITGEGKPEDNATNSADPDSPFGPDGSIADALQHFQAIDDTIEKVREELGGAGGLTQAAIEARDAARLAATNSATARDESRAARDAANTASGQALGSAQAAAGSAGTAEGQATIASTKATTATEQASIATAKATVATTKAGEASTSASNAATSEQNAGGSATAAATSAKTAADASDAAGRSATAASNSQSSAAASAGDAGQRASAAAESATSAGTSAGQANTSAGQAATSATSASGSATVASIAATVSASSASGNLVKHGDFSDGNSGYWPVGPYETRMIRPRDYGQTLPPGQEWVYLMRGYRDALEEYGWNGGIGNGAPNAGRIAGDWGNRVIRVEALASAEFSPNDAACGFFGYGADGSILQFGGVTAAVAGVAGYRSIKSDIVVSAGVVKIVPWLQNNGPPGFETQEGRWARFSLRDVTEEVRAGQSASAAAGSASTAGTRADDAGRSASAAQTSYTNAEASNRGAAASAQSAAGWASAADGSRASVASYAEQAASFRDAAGGSAASARSSADAAASSTGALSQRVDQVETDVGGAKSSASSALTAVNDVKTGLSGARLRYVAQSSGGRAIFELVSDNAGGARWQLGGDGLIDGNLMLTGSLTGPKIASGAISGTASIEGGSVGLRTTALTDAASVGYVGNGGRASITFSGIVTLSPGAPVGTRMQVYLSINGAIKIGPLRVSATRGSEAPFCFTTLADINGQVNVTLSAQATNGSGSGDPHLIDNPTIILLDMKKLGG
jgi:hypothetical protein